MVYPFKTPNKGWGLAAGEHIPIGTFVIQYVGEVFDTETKLGKERLSRYKGSTCTYLMKTHKTQVIDPSDKGNLARFINHSCDPNCETQKWNVLGEICVGIFAVKDIKEGEEITFDYRFDSYSTPLTKCYCGAAKCKGYLGVIPPTMSPEKWEKKLESLPCVVCASVEETDDNQMLLCDDCNRGFHALCLTPPIHEIPKEEWYCVNCSEKRAAICQEVAASVKINPPVSEPISQFTTEEIRGMTKEVDQEMIAAEKDLKTYKNELAAIAKPETATELNGKISHIERKFSCYSKNFLFFYLLQKKIKKKLKPEKQKSEEAQSPRKKKEAHNSTTGVNTVPDKKEKKVEEDATNNQSKKIETQQEKQPAVEKIPKLPEPMETNKEDYKEKEEKKAKSPRRKNPIAAPAAQSMINLVKINSDPAPTPPPVIVPPQAKTLPPATSTQIIEKPVELPSGIKEKSIPCAASTPKGEPQKTQKEDLQKELETELRKITKRKEEDPRTQQPAEPSKKEHEVFRIPSKELESIRLCMNVSLKEIYL